MEAIFTPDTAKGQWSMVSGQKRHLTCEISFLVSEFCTEERMVKKGLTRDGVGVSWSDVGQGHVCPFSSQLNLSAHTMYRVVDLVVMLLVTLVVVRLVAVVDPASSSFFFLDPWSL